MVNITNELRERFKDSNEVTIKKLEIVINGLSNYIDKKYPTFNHMSTSEQRKIIEEYISTFKRIAEEKFIY